ncbi:MAG: radical SAM protein, partial [Dethiobacteria bacterium]
EALALRGSLNFHPGLVGAAEAAAMGEIARVISFDFVADRAVIEEVYGLEASPDDYIRSYRYLRRYNRVVPHICIGIMGGRIESEYRALEILRREGAEAISFIVFRPTPGTRFAGAAPPPPGEVAELLAHARFLFPRTPLFLGCMRPGGSYREKLDCLALVAGINKIVHPAAAAKRLALQMGLHIVAGEECCAL